MMRNITEVEFVLEKKTFRFMCDIDTPISLVKEALFQLQNYVGKIEENAKEQQKAKEESQSEKVEDGNQQ